MAREVKARDCSQTLEVAREGFNPYDLLYVSYASEFAAGRAR
jgi:hypothetical protein